MKSFINSNTAINWIGYFCVLVYIYAMLIYPWIAHDFSWPHVHAVWHDWQTFNAAVLAFLASWIAFKIARTRDERVREQNADQRKRDYFATSALLPAAFSELSAYLKASAGVLNQLWEEIPPMPIAPEPASFYREVFQDCIRHADNMVAKYLKQILFDLQVLEARLDSLTSNNVVADSLLLIGYFYSIAKLKVSIDKQFEFARDEKYFDDSLPVWQDFKNAYSVLGINRGKYIDKNINLVDFTKQMIEKLKK